MNIAVFGAEGRTGSAAVRIAKGRGHYVVPIEKETRTEQIADRVDVVIDFSAANATKDVCEFCLARNAPLVTGVTGRNEQEQAELQALRERLPTVERSNFSEGVQTLAELVKYAAETLADWDCEIVEIHRKGKRDSPSGTAKMLAAVAAKRKSFSKVTVHSLRCGGNFGRHSVIFATEGESLTLTHQAENADIFARGAVICAEKLFLSTQNVADGKGIGTVDGN